MNLHVQISWQAQHFVTTHTETSPEFVAGTALCEPPCSVRDSCCCVVGGGRRWSPVRSSIVIRVFHLFLDVQISWQAQHFVNLHVQISWQAQHFVTTHTETSPEFVAGTALCEPPCSIRGSGCCVVGGGRRWSPVRSSIVIRVFTGFLTCRFRGNSPTPLSHPSVV